MKLNNCNRFFLIIIIVSILSCGSNNEAQLPKPYGFMRLELPVKNYAVATTNCGYNFELPTYALLQNSAQANTHACWKNIEFNTFKATVHLSYFKLDNNLAKYIDDARNLAYRHSVKAEYINETFYKNDANKTYAVVYDIGGNAASNCQFFITDSTYNFVRGALYFNVAPNSDSLKPVSEFIKTDIQHVIETFKWK
jgi:gliding motility-associated lipoprotein GldD